MAKKKSEETEVIESEAAIEMPETPETDDGRKTNAELQIQVESLAGKVESLSEMLSNVETKFDNRFSPVEKENADNKEALRLFDERQAMIKDAVEKIMEFAESLKTRETSNQIESFGAVDDGCGKCAANTKRIEKIEEIIFGAIQE